MLFKLIHSKVLDCFTFFFFLLKKVVSYADQRLSIDWFDLFTTKISLTKFIIQNLN